jgi:hypothetical protein
MSSSYHVSERAIVTSFRSATSAFIWGPARFPLTLHRGDVMSQLGAVLP